MFDTYKLKFKPKFTKNSILFKFAIIFSLFIILTLIATGILTYVYQESAYRKQQEKKLHDIADYLSLVIQVNGRGFANYQDFFMKHHQELLVPIDFAIESISEARQNFIQLFEENYSSKDLSDNINIEDLNHDVKMAYGVNMYEYYYTLFEEAKRRFDIAYVYYIVPNSSDLTACYMIDCVREKLPDNENYIFLGDTVPQEIEKHKFLWEAWNTGKAPHGYDIFDNKFGHTYAWYVPLYIDGEKLGLIGVEIFVANYNQAILINILWQLLIIAGILIVAVLLTLYAINKLYILRIKHLAEDIFQYSSSKDAKLAGVIEKTTAGRDEIAELGNQTAAMIMELENYMKSLINITNQLSETKEQVHVMSKLANKDALTGVKNRNAYEQEIKHLEWQIADGKTKFGIAMADLNYLKRINDTYGHEHGNFALKKCCDMLCKVFNKSSVFRIGGDEFVVILENDDYEHIEEKINEFNKLLSEQKKDSSLQFWEKISVAIGFAKFEPSQDQSVSNVFKRADKAMYSRKLAMKANRKK